MKKITPSRNDQRSIDMNPQHPRGAANIAARVAAGHLDAADAAQVLRAAAKAGSEAAAKALNVVSTADVVAEK